MKKNLLVFFISICLIISCVNIYAYSLNDNESNLTNMASIYQVNSTVGSSKVGSGNTPEGSDSNMLSVPGLLGTGIEIPGVNNNNIGIIAWALVGFVILIILIILIRNKRANNSLGNIGRKRYKRSSGHAKKKRLLNDKYYNKLKYK